MSSTPRFDRFVTAVHRRAVAVRLIEGFGAGVGVGAGLALFIILIQLRDGVHWQGIAIFGAFPAVCSAIAWWRDRPSRLAAVIEADRQLKLDDLLSSAMTAKDDAFGHAVRAMAERACLSLSPSQVILNRFGVRAWGGIGLAWATVIILVLLAGNGADSRAGDRSLATSSGVSAKSGEMTASSAEHLAGAEQGADDPRNTGSTDVEPSTTGQASKTGSKVGDASTGSGGGHAETGSSRVAPTESHAATGGATSPNGETAGGTGAGRPGTGSTTSGGLGGSRADRSAAPWRSDHWPADRATALQSVRDGRVPDAYRDLVRDYFEPNQK